MLVACCFAELAAEFPLAGGVYQWARQVGRGAAGRLAGWVTLAGAVVAMASVAVALQGTLPRLVPWFQWVGDAADPAASARNAVLLGCGLVALSTLINVAGVRVMARVNNIGAFAELAGAVLLAGLLFAASRRGPAVVFEAHASGPGGPLGNLGPYLVAALTPAFVMCGFDSAGTLAEETRDPRRHAPRAILGSLAAVGVMGALLILGALQAAPDLADPGLGRMGQGMPAIIASAIGPTGGRLLLADVSLAIAVCTLTVHAAAVRLVFSMARDGGLPWSGTLAALPGAARSPTVPALLIGLAAMALLLINLNSPSVVELLAALSIVWGNLGYLLVTVPQLLRRLRRAGRGDEAAPLGGKRFDLGRWGLPINGLAVVWSGALVADIAWPRPEIYGEPWPRRFVALWATAALVGVGLIYGGWSRRRGRPDVLVEHRAPRPRGALGRAVEVSEERLQ